MTNSLIEPLSCAFFNIDIDFKNVIEPTQTQQDLIKNIQKYIINSVTSYKISLQQFKLTITACKNYSLNSIIHELKKIKFISINIFLKDGTIHESFKLKVSLIDVDFEQSYNLHDDICMINIYFKHNMDNTFNPF